MCTDVHIFDTLTQNTETYEYFKFHIKYLKKN